MPEIGSSDVIVLEGGPVTPRAVRQRQEAADASVAALLSGGSRDSGGVESEALTVEESELRDRMAMSKRRAAWHRSRGLKWAEVARLVGVSARTVKNWSREPGFVRALAEYAMSDTERLEAARGMLAGRALDYLCEADRMAFDVQVPAHIRADLLKNLMDRSSVIPSVLKAASGGGEAVGPEGTLPVSVEVLRLIGETLAQSLGSSRPTVIEVAPVAEPERIGEGVVGGGA